jgi:hypothetical protein
VSSLCVSRGEEALLTGLFTIVGEMTIIYLPGAELDSTDTVEPRLRAGVDRKAP